MQRARREVTSARRRRKEALVVGSVIGEPKSVQDRGRYAATGTPSRKTNPGSLRSTRTAWTHSEYRELVQLAGAITLPAAPWRVTLHRQRYGRERTEGACCHVSGTEGSIDDPRRSRVAHRLEAQRHIQEDARRRVPGAVQGWTHGRSLVGARGRSVGCCSPPLPRGRRPCSQVGGIRGPLVHQPRGASRTGPTVRSSARRRTRPDAPAPSRTPRAARWSARWPRFGRTT